MYYPFEVVSAFENLLSIKIHVPSFSVMELKATENGKAKDLQRN